MIRDIIKGSLVLENETSNVVVVGKVTTTKLVDQKSSHIQPDFTNAFKSLYEEIVMSYISEPFLEIAMRTEVECLRRRWENRFK